MSWPLIIAGIVKLLWPFFEKWIDDLFKKAEAELSQWSLPASLGPEETVKTVFRIVRREMSWWQRLWYSRAVDRYERVALRHAVEIRANGNPYLTHEDAYELRG